MATIPIDPEYVIRRHAKFKAEVETVRDPDMPGERVLRVSHNGYQFQHLNLDPIEARKVIDLLETFAAPYPPNARKPNASNASLCDSATHCPLCEFWTPPKGTHVSLIIHVGRTGGTPAGWHQQGEAPPSRPRQSHQEGERDGSD